MKATEAESPDSTENTRLTFTRGHEILLTGLIGSGMSYRDIFHLEMALKTEEDAVGLAVWMRDRLDETGGFPSPEEILRQAGMRPVA